MKTFSWNFFKRDRWEIGNQIRLFKKKTGVSLAVLGIAVLSSFGNLRAAEPLAVNTGLGVKATLYGFAWFDAIVTDNRSYTGNSTFWALDQSKVKNDGETRLSVNSTRLGFNFAGPEDANTPVTGKVEVDFFGTGTENAAGFRLRQAYANVSNSAKSFSILAGQAWDVIAPLNPPTLDAGILFYSGNLGIRRPQLRLTETSKIGENGKFEVAVAAVRSIGVSVAATGQADTGRSANAPGVESRIGLSLDSWVPKQTVNVGIGGLYARHQLFTNAGGNADASIPLESKAVAGDLEVPFTPQASIAAEGYQGAGLSSYAGNIGQDFVLATNLSQSFTYKGWGGWSALRLKANATWSGNVGVGYDRLKNKTQSLPGTARYQNVTTFANVWYNVTTATKFGLEYAHLRTSYVATGDASLNRGQFSVVYSF